MGVDISAKAARDEKWDYPLEALREAVVNAIVHRDYTDPDNIQIRIFDNRLEI
jgi:ATP-dependent DNA helicase RecG